MAASTDPMPEKPDAKYSHLASNEAIDRAAKHLRDHGFEVVVVSTADEARAEALARVPKGVSVLDLTSRTLEETGIVTALSEREDLDIVKDRTRTMDRKTQGAEIRRLTQAPDVAIGSVHAVTEDGQVLVASATGSQIGPYAFGASRVVWVVGAQKLVGTLEEGLHRIERYAFPLEDARAHAAYGVGSSINRILIFRRENQPGRTTLILVKKKLGF